MPTATFDPMQGTYRIVVETEPAIRTIRDALSARRVRGVTWWLDEHVSNLGHLKAILAEQAPSVLGWEICVQEEVDEQLIASDRVVATSDSAILVGCTQLKPVNALRKPKTPVCVIRTASTIADSNLRTMISAQVYASYLDRIDDWCSVEQVVRSYGSFEPSVRDLRLTPPGRGQWKSKK